MSIKDRLRKLEQRECRGRFIIVTNFMPCHRGKTREQILAELDPPLGRHDRVYYVDPPWTAGRRI